MAPKPAKDGTLARGGQPEADEDFYFSLMQPSIEPKYLIYMRAYDITNDQLWDVRRFIWRYLRMPVGWTPTEDNKYLKANQPALLWQLERKSVVNEWYLHDVIVALQKSPSFPWFTKKDINVVVRDRLIKMLIKKEWGVMQDNETLQDVHKERDFQVEVFQAKPPPTAVTPSNTAASTNKRKRAKQFSMCSLKIVLPGADIRYARIVELCNGRKEYTFDDLKLASIKATVEGYGVVEGQFFIGLYKNLASKSGWVPITTDERLSKLVSTQYFNDKSGGGLEIEVRKGRVPNIRAGESDSD